MNRTLGIIFALLLAFSATGAELDRNVFSLLDLNRKGLEKVKALYQEGKETEAAGALLNYFRE
ncbi:MAG TPA: heparinase II/III family protein, partial [Prolixibacteraceae bacterium]|nr:heparinase II/III family protein [Prolixibacteraceae bacterium]